MDFEIRFSEKASAEDLATIDRGINEHLESIFDSVQRGSLVYMARDKLSNAAGGVSGYWSSLGWLYINSLWVDEIHRGSGLGRRLMGLIESEAVRRGCKYAYLNTMSFQAPGFYKKLGYTVFGKLDDFPGENSLIFMRKTLVSGPGTKNYSVSFGADGL
jgi:ribosomal protein S18 acetylase RimI-like enzyme